VEFKSRLEEKVAKSKGPGVVVALKRVAAGGIDARALQRMSIAKRRIEKVVVLTWSDVMRRIICPSNQWRAS